MAEALATKSRLPQRTSAGEKYTITGVLGEGGLGTVYSAEGPGGVQYAVKDYNNLHRVDRLPSDLTRVRQQLFQTAQLYGGLGAHPHIATLHELMPDGKLVMEKVNGETLTQRVLHTGKMFPQEALTFAGQILMALEHVREGNLVHNDVKPGNVVLHKDAAAGLKVAKLIDFDSLSVPGIPVGEIFGSKDYCAPERFRGELPTERSDVFSVGVSLYKALTGEMPFPEVQISGSTRKNPAQTLTEKLGAENMTPLLRAIEPVLMKTLADNPRKRPTLRKLREKLVKIAAKHKAPITKEVEFSNLKRARLKKSELAEIGANLEASSSFALPPARREPAVQISAKLAAKVEQSTGFMRQPLAELLRRPHVEPGRHSLPKRGRHRSAERRNHLVDLRRVHDARVSQGRHSSDSRTEVIGVRREQSTVRLVTALQPPEGPTVRMRVLEAPTQVLPTRERETEGSKRRLLRDVIGAYKRGRTLSLAPEDKETVLDHYRERRVRAAVGVMSFGAGIASYLTITPGFNMIGRAFSIFGLL